MGRFCFWAFASFCFVRKDLWEGIVTIPGFQIEGLIGDDVVRVEGGSLGGGILESDK